MWILFITLGLILAVACFVYINIIRFNNLTKKEEERKKNNWGIM